MVVADRRRAFIVSTAGNFFGIPTQDDESKIENVSVLEKFFDQSTCRTLCAHPISENSDEISLKLTNELPVGKNTLVFFKVNIPKTNLNC